MAAAQHRRERGASQDARFPAKSGRSGVCAGSRAKQSATIGASRTRPRYAEADAAKVRDVLVDLGGTVSAGPFVSAGGALFVQRFDTRGTAPDRSTGAAELGLGLASTVALPRGFYALADVGTQTYRYRGPGGLEGSAALRLALGLGWRP